MVAPLRVVDKKEIEKYRKKKKWSEKDFTKLASISYEGANNNKEKLERTIAMLERLIPIAEGVYLSRPGQSSCYSLSNLITQLSELNEQLEDMVDFDDLGTQVYKSSIEPFVSELIKHMGKEIKDMSIILLPELPKKHRKRVERMFKAFYRKYAKTCDEKMTEAKVNMEDCISEYL